MAAKPAVDAYEDSNETVQYAVASSQGHRPEMQDSHTVNLDVDGAGTALFAVFDGHGGSAGAKHCSEAVVDVLKHELGPARKRKAHGPDLTVALRECILELDEQVLERFSRRQGTTATLALLRGNELVVAGVGDSRAILARDGRPVELTIEHKPTDPEEEARIEAAGGYVSIRGRVQDSLNMSRALGDGQFKDDHRAPEEQMVSPEPDITQVWLSANRDHWLLLASDGLWNALSEEEVVQYIYKGLRKGAKLRNITKELVTLANKPSHTAHDNVTIILVQPKQLPVDGAAEAQDAPAEAATFTPEGTGTPAEEQGGDQDAGGDDAGQSGGAGRSGGVGHARAAELSAGAKWSSGGPGRSPAADQESDERHRGLADAVAQAPHGLMGGGDGGLVGKGHGKRKLAGAGASDDDGVAGGETGDGEEMDGTGQEGMVQEARVVGAGVGNDQDNNEAMLQTAGWPV